MSRKISADQAALGVSPEAVTAPSSKGEASIKTVRMLRDEPAHPGGPTEADVHPDEVEGWALHGWRAE